MEHPFQSKQDEDHTPLNLSEAILFDPVLHSRFIPSFVSIHHESITDDHTIATFHPPLSIPTLFAWWIARIGEHTRGSRKIIIHLATNPTTREVELAGYVMLDLPFTETGLRGWVEKLLVASRYRQMGVARRMMQKLEDVAREEGVTLLMLDTESGSPAELVYPKLGYVKLGTIPSSGKSPQDGSFRDETIFYKKLQ